MKNIKNLIYLLVAVLLAGTITSCSKDATYEPGQQPEGAQVFFSNAAGSQIDIPENASLITIPVLRNNTSGAYTAQIIVTSPDTEVLTIPDVVTFADGQRQADLKITFDFAKIASDYNYNIKLKLEDINNTTPYGSAEYAFTLLYSPWKVLGTGLYTDDMMTSIYSIDPYEFEVEVQESETTPGKYRIKNPYHQNSPFFKHYSFEESTGATSDYFIVVDASDPAKIMIPKQPLGITTAVAGYGNLGIATAVYGSISNGIIRFPAKGLIMVRDAGSYYSNTNGAFKLALPGAIEPVTIAIGYKGQFMSPAGQHSAILSFTPDKMTAKYWYTVVPGDITKDAAKIKEVTDKILAGEIAAEMKMEAAEINYPIAAAGAYTAVAIPIDGKDNVGTTGVKSFNFVLGEQVKLQTGSYSVAVSAQAPYVSDFVIEETEEPNLYAIDGLYGISDLPLNAYFDPVNLTLTLDGTTVEDPSEKIWLQGLGYANPEKTMLWCLAGSGNNLEGDIVISIDKDGVPVKFTQTWGIVVFEAASGNMQGWMERIMANTPISAAPATAKAAFRKTTPMASVMLVK